ncbi:MAG: leucine-rich repeat domain-containing protein [Bacteroidaceae bacterium]|nr:leucine-rich repeat domain-containing protein [Bacteroidaceae bacterium]
MYRNLLGIVAGLLLLLAGCSNDETMFEQEDNTEGLKTFTSFTATLDDVAGTRAYLDAEASNGIRRVHWEGGDVISVYSDTDTELKEYRLTSLSDDNKATFTGEKVTGNKFYAVFSSYNEFSVDVKNPAIVHFERGGTRYDAKLGQNVYFGGPMVASSTGNVLAFKQTTGIIQITVGNIPKIWDISLYGNNYEPLGKYSTVDLSASQPVLKLDPEANIVGFGGGYSELNDNYVDIYYVIPPTVFENGFHLSIEGVDYDGNEFEIEKRYNSEFEVKVGTLSKFSLVDISADIIKQQQEAEEAAVKTRAALERFYQALGGDNWNNNTNWCTDAPLYEWYGLSVDNAGAVISINMYDNNLSGAIPAEIGNLSGLRSLYLSKNNITSLPEEISQLPLEYLYLDGCSLSSLPESFGQLKSLNILYLGNQFTEIPAAVRQLKSLKTLGMANNRITEVPSWLAELTNLSYIILNNNQLTGELPTAFANMPNLRYLYLYNNNFTGSIPESYFTNLINLETLNLVHNYLSGVITKEMQQSAMWQHLSSLSINPQRNGNVITIENGVSSIELNAEELTLKVGETFQFEATAFPEDATKRAVTWEYGYRGSSKPYNILGDGYVEAVSEGEFLVYAYATDGSDVEAVCHVQVISASSDLKTGDIEGYTGDDLNWDN